MKLYPTIVLLAFLLVACGGSPPAQTEAPVSTNNEADTSSTEDTSSSDVTEVASTSDEEERIISVDPTLFLSEGLVGDITEEPCTLSGGTETTCYRFSVLSTPVDHEAGPWCPGTISDSAEAGGIWPENGVVNDVDGPFIRDLAIFYNDDTWQLYNEDGSIRVTDSVEACAAAARPNVAEEYQNYCVQCLPSYMEDGALLTYVIPITPVVLEAPSAINNTVVGVAFNGVNFDPPAPTNDILSAHTLAPFDDCGGHVNLASGYHYHAHTGCTTEIAQTDGHAPMIGYALDGFPLYALLDENGEEPADLDACGGHTDDVRGYHYHVASAGTNSFISCFQAEYGCTFEGDGAGQACDASVTGRGRGEGPGTGGAPDFTAAAAQLGISEEALRDALSGPPPDFEAAAATLGITAAELQDALDGP